MRKVTHETFVWRSTIEGQAKSFDIPVRSWCGDGDSGVERPVLALCGMGERLGTSKRIVRYLGKKGVKNALSLRLPFEILPPSEANLTRISTEVPLQVAQALAEKTSSAEVDMIARSQSAAPALMSLAEHPELFYKTALIEPFGLTNQLLGVTAEERIDEFGDRMAQNLRTGWRQNKSLLSVRELLTTVRTKEAQRNARVSLLAAMSIEHLPDEFMEQVESGRRLRVFASKDDPIFPYDELVSVVGRNNVTEVRGAHASSVSVNGFRQLDSALEWLQEPDRN